VSPASTPPPPTTSSPSSAAPGWSSRWSRAARSPPAPGRVRRGRQADRVGRHDRHAAERHGAEQRHGRPDRLRPALHLSPSPSKGAEGRCPPHPFQLSARSGRSSAAHDHRRCRAQQPDPHHAGHRAARRSEVLREPVFSDAGGVEGGAILYELPPTTADRPVRRARRPGGRTGRGVPAPHVPPRRPVVAKPRKLGAKWFVTKEQRKRNDIRIVQRAMVQTANTIALTLDAMAIAVLNAAITANSRTLAGQSWATAAGVTRRPGRARTRPTSDLLSARRCRARAARHTSLDSAPASTRTRSCRSRRPRRIGTSISELFARSGSTNWFSSRA
jgi:hypothetical protein